MSRLKAAISFVVYLFLTVYLGLDKSPIFSAPTLIFLFFIFWVVSFCFHLSSHHLRDRFGEFLWGFCSFLLFSLGLLLLSCTRQALQFGLAEFYSFLGVGSWSQAILLRIKARSEKYSGRPLTNGFLRPNSESPDSASCCQRG